LKVYKENVVAFHVYQKIGFQIIDDLSETKEYKMALPLSEKKVNEVLNGRSNVAYIP
jgi:ribosomal protein S18 acetylase RimI-like enzyme